MDTIIQALARELGRTEEHVQNVVTLIDEGATIPFIARYRKELHGSMDDQLLRQLADQMCIRDSPCFTPSISSRAGG